MPDNDGKIKVYHNPNRTRMEVTKPYVPEYQVHGIEPSEYRGAIVPGNLKIAKPSADNPRLKRVPLRQPYATAASSPIGRGRGPVPNVGNNMEHTWSNVDGEVIDDLSDETIDSNTQMVDNNDFVSDQAFGFQNGVDASNIQPQFTMGNVVIESSKIQSQEEAGDLLSVVSDLSPDSFLLLVDGVPVCSGPKEEIEEQARAFLYGEVDVCDGNPTPIDDILVLKRVRMKVGLFLE